MAIVHRLPSTAFPVRLASWGFENGTDGRGLVVIFSIQGFKLLAQLYICERQILTLIDDGLLPLAAQDVTQEFLDLRIHIIRLQIVSIVRVDHITAWRSVGVVPRIAAVLAQRIAADERSER